MESFIIAVITGAVGICLLLSGYKFARVLIPLFGFVSGFALGASVFGDMMGDSLLGTTTGIFVGLVLGATFAVFAYMYYALAIIVLGACLGYWLGNQFVLVLGFNPGILSVLSGVVLGTLAGFAAYMFQLPKYVLIGMTAIVGATSTIGALLLLFNQIPLSVFSYATAQAAISYAPLWGILTAILAAVGMVVQARTTEGYELEKWYPGDTPVLPPTETPTHA